MWAGFPGSEIFLGKSDLRLVLHAPGFVPRENIMGKPLIIYWSYDAPTEELAGPMLSVAHLKDLALNFFKKTRWRRAFMLTHGYPMKADAKDAVRPTVFVQQ